MELILASNSPRRKDILHEAGFTFEIIPSKIDENISKLLPPEKYVVTLSKQKAIDVFLFNKNKVVLGADTIVYFNGQILGKPKDENDAIKMLKMLSNNTHKVITGYTIIYKDNCISNYDTTFVTFNNLTDELIDSYIKSGLYKGKAGSYGIQDGFNLVNKIEGSYNNVVGLPIEKISKILKEII